MGSEHTRRVGDGPKDKRERKWTALLDEIETLKRDLFLARKEKEAIGSLLLDLQKECINLRQELARVNREITDDGAG